MSRVLVATDGVGHPVILISSLSPHFAALENNPDCSLLLGEPGKGDPLAHPRITLACHAERIEDAGREVIRQRFLSRHPKSALYADFGDFAFWRLTVRGASLNGGFGKAYDMTAEDVLSDEGVAGALSEIEASAVAHMNEDHADAVDAYASFAAGKDAGTGWQFVDVDPEGIQIRKGDRLVRVWFEAPLAAADDLRMTLAKLAKQARLAG